MAVNRNHILQPKLAKGILTPPIFTFLMAAGHGN